VIPVKPPDQLHTYQEFVIRVNRRPLARSFFMERTMKLEDFLIKEEGDDSRHLPNGQLASTWDSLGHVWNIGPGLTQGITKSTVWTPDQLAAAEAAEFASTRAAVAHLVKVPLGENQTTVLESFCYNVGVHGFATSSVLKDVNDKDFADVPAALRRWNKAGGEVCRGLINRREAEIRLWNHPDGDSVRADLSTPKAAPQPDHPDVKSVAWLQGALNSIQHPTQPLAVDNSPGPRTRSAVLAFQKDHGLTADGVPGPKTIAAIEAALSALSTATSPLPLAA
jgi:GH24 family phage-related lysozyme (muramidase)